MIEWKIQELGAICDRLSSGKNITAKDINETGKFPVYGGNGIRGYADRSNFQGECAVIGRQGAYCGNVRYFSGEAYMTEHALVVQANQKNDTRFLAYYLSIMNLGRLSGQSAQPGLAVKTLAKQKVKIPPLYVQEKIVAVLSVLDDKIELNNAINNNIEQQIEALLMAFIEEAGTILVKLGDYLYIKGRIGWKGLKKNEYLPQSNYRIINGETLTKSGIDWNKAGYISEERYLESPEIMLNVGDILLSKDGTIGKIGYVDSLDLPTSVASGIFIIRNNKPNIISTTFIYYLLQSRLFENFIALRTEGSVIPHLYQRDFMEFEFPLPNSNRMAEFEMITESMFSQIIGNLRENKVLTTLKDSLLPKLMTREVDISDIDF